MVVEIRYRGDGRKGKRAETAADKCGGIDVGQQEQRKCSEGK